MRKGSYRQLDANGLAYGVQENSYQRKGYIGAQNSIGCYGW